uniref:Uncharacterized protein n=1 Tax=Oryzias sinensis TaxID=183150 RepID=A0A8C7X1D7_9TELE
MQFLGVQHAQICVSLLDVIHVLHGQLQTRQDNLSVCCDLWVGGDGGGVVEVPKAAKVPLSPGTSNKTTFTQNIFIHLFWTFSYLLPFNQSMFF